MFPKQCGKFSLKKVYYSVILRKKSRFQPFLSPKTGGKSVKTENGILYLVKNGVFFPQRKSILFDMEVFHTLLESSSEFSTHIHRLLEVNGKSVFSFFLYIY